MDDSLQDSMTMFHLEVLLILAEICIFLTVETCRVLFISFIIYSRLGNFKAGSNGAILKKASKAEILCLRKLMDDVLRPYIPEYKGEVKEDGERIFSLVSVSHF